MTTIRIVTIVGLCLISQKAVGQVPAISPNSKATNTIHGKHAPKGLTLAALQEIALANNPTLAMAAARIDAAEGNWVQVGLSPNPVIGYAAEEMGDDGTAGKQGAFIKKEFMLGGKLRLSRQVASHQIERAEQEWTAQRLRVLTDVRIGFYDVLLSQRRLEMVQELVKISEKAVKVAEAFIKAKEASRVDLLQARIERDMARIELQNTQNEHRATWRKLAAMLGTPQMEPQPLVGKVEKVVKDLTWSNALRRVTAESPEMAVALALVERARCALQLAHAGRIPNVEMKVGVQHDNPSGDTVVGVGVGFPLPLFNRNQGRIREAEAELTAAEHNVQRVELGLQHRLAEVFGQYANARNQVSQYTGQILLDAKETLDLVDAGYRAGEFGFLNLLTAQRTYFETNLAYVEALRQLWAATAEIDGLLLREGLQVAN